MRIIQFMAIPEIGIKSSTLAEILAGRKTIESRLAKERFLSFKVGDEISLREDVWKNGEIVRSIPARARIVVTDIQRFETFRKLLETVGFENIMPAMANVDEALEAYKLYYSAEDERQYGVLAISFKLIK